jgi:nitrogen fixation/metabolism regulation signal transduction histidine kinase
MRRIRTRLIAAFLFVALLPAVPLTLLVHSLLVRSFGPGLGQTIEQGLEAGLAESRARLHGCEDRFRQAVERVWLPRLVAGDLDSLLAQGGEGPPVLLLSGDGAAAAAPVRMPSPEQAERLRGGLRERPLTDRAIGAGAPEAGDGGQSQDQPVQPAGVEPVRVGSHLAALVADRGGGDVIFATALPEGMTRRAGELTGALSLLRLLRQDRGAVLRGYVLPFLLVYGFLLVVAAGLGTYLARRLAQPVEALSAATRQVAAGDLSVRVRRRAPGEIGELVSAFDRMVERLQAQRRELARLERIAAWRNMARTLAHEIKNPLTPILLAVQSVRQGYRGQDEAHARALAECEEIVDEEVAGLRDLVRRFADFARLPRPEPIESDLGELCEEIARLYGGQKVACRFAVADLGARLDPAEMKRALINLIDNGLAACRQAGRPERVELAVDRQPGRLVITVRDEGSGIPADNLERIFEPDFSTKAEGMGLGLPAVMAVVQGHGGQVEVQSEPGRGTTFTVRLPQVAPLTPGQEEQA